MPAAPAPRHLNPEGPHVHKFGGSSLADANGFRRVAAILRERSEPEWLAVVSALQGVTDMLVALGAGDAHRDAVITTLRERHRRLVIELEIATIWAGLSVDFDWLAGLPATRNAWSPGLRAQVQGLGECWSAQCLAALLQRDGATCPWVDARRFLTVRWGSVGAVVDWPRCHAAWRDWRTAEPAKRGVVTGFIASLPDGTPTTLGRNGSDYSAAIVATLANAAELTLWGDTAGVLSADPSVVSEAQTIANLSYAEASELAYFGARVIHPQTIAPVIHLDMPIRVRSSTNPEHPGTRIGSSTREPAFGVKGLSLLPDVTLIDIEGTGALGVPGTAQRVFAALEAMAISVNMISQGSSAHSLCCAVHSAHAVRAQAALANEFADELAAGFVLRIGLRTQGAILTVVGDGMAGQPGVAARFTAGMARARVNIRAIAQGASERSISLAVDAGDAARALRAAHAAFLLSDQTVAIAVIGVGQVGRALLDQLRSAQARLRQRRGLDLRIRAIADSRHAWLDDAADVLPPDWRDRLGASPARNLGAVALHLQPGHFPHALVIDCTASEAVADAYADWLRAGIHVITPSKRAVAGPLPRWQAIQSASMGMARLRYEASVGAGLPVIQTLRELIDTGDDLMAVDGVLSGTLSWLFNTYDGSVPFSALVREAIAQGYAEPDPRDDLAGLDVARKLVILAREAGVPMHLDAVQVESLVPAPLANGSRAVFLERLQDMDDSIAKRHSRAASKGCVLRHLAQLDAQGNARIGLREVPRHHAAAHLQGTDNLIQFHTRRYCNTPLVIQGPGAGPEVTAAGVFADILRLTDQLGSVP